METEEKITMENDEKITMENDEKITMENDEKTTMENDEKITMENDGKTTMENDGKTTMENEEKKHISFGSIEQFRHCVTRVRKRAERMGVDYPKYSFHGTVKLHGTNASVVYDPATGEMYAQSRNLVITRKNDNKGFANFFESHTEAFQPLFTQALALSRGSSDPIRVVIFGEWCGGKIQPGVALSLLPTQFVIFDVCLIMKFGEGEERNIGQWLTPRELGNLTVSSEYAALIRVIEHFQTWDVEIDFNEPETAQNILIQLTQEVEDECPFGKANGVSGLGEGIVWARVYNSTDPGLKMSGLTFKTKGEKHADTKMKVIVPVDAEKSDSILQFAEAVVTDHRLDKMLDKLREKGYLAMDVKNMGTFLKLVREDILKEEEDLLAASGFVWKDALKEITKKSRQWYTNKLNAMSLSEMTLK